jgi:pimeloyl-ACP methyl ester carboxylesterase
VHTVAQQAIEQYKSGRLRTIMIVGHSLGGSAASWMAAELGQAGVPVQLVVMLRPGGRVGDFLQRPPVGEYSPRQG